MKSTIWTLLLPCLLVLAGCAGAVAPVAEQTSVPAAQVDVHTEEAHDDEAHDDEAHGEETLPVLVPVALAPGEKMRVVATTNLVADVVAHIGGNAIDLIALLPPGADPHAYQATPNDLRAISDAHLLFVNGLGLEESLASVLDQAQAGTISVNAGVELISEEAIPSPIL